MQYDQATYGQGPGPAAPPPPHPQERPRPIAPAWHTFALLGLFGLSTYVTSHRATAAMAGALQTPRLIRYGTSIGLEWLLLGLVLLGIYRRREFLRTAFMNRAYGWGEMLASGFAVYIIGFLAILIAGLALFFTPFFHHRNEAVISGLTPHTPLEFLVWFGLSLTAGVCEELIFRGYLLQQLEAWTGRPIASIVLGALLFGSVHLYEGTAAVIPLAVLALVYGMVVRRFHGDLRAVIVAHTLQDFIVALLLLLRPFLQQFATRH